MSFHTSHIRESVTYLKDRGITGAELGIILGSGFDALAETLTDRWSIPYGEIPHMVPAGVPGHRGLLEYGMLGDKCVFMFRGRIHYYEGHPLWKVTYPVRLMQALAVPEILLTAAVGGLREGLQTGDLVLITDHINLMGGNPLHGLSDPGLGERFVEMHTAYDPVWRLRLHQSALRSGVSLTEGVYAAMHGPSLETPAECRFLHRIGADVVGMSVVPEVIVGVQAGIRMAALCVVTNINWPLENKTIADPEHILRMAQKKNHHVSAILTSLS